MKIVHLMQSGQHFTRSVCEFYDLFFDHKEHEICFVNRDKKVSMCIEGLKIKQSEVHVSNSRDVIGNKKLLDKMIKYDYVVVHGMFLTPILLAFVLTNRVLLNKIVWIEWGCDLYQWRDSGKGIKVELKNLINEKFRNKCRFFIAIFPPDKDFFLKTANNEQVISYYAPYSGSKIPKQYAHYSSTSRLEISKKNDECIYIQVGHNSNEGLNHIKVLHLLKKFNQENIKLIIPLSYGGSISYADKVQEKAESWFPGKVICLRNKISQDAYFELIDRIDIGIFNTMRQAGLGNIHYMNFKNVKLYMPQNSVMYKYFKEQGIPIQQYEFLQDISFDEFTKVVKVTENKRFEDYIDNLCNIEKQVKMWKDIYDDLRLRLSNI